MVMDAEMDNALVIHEFLAYKPSILQERIISIARQLMENHHLFDSEMLYFQCIRTIKDVKTSAINSAIVDLLNKHVLINGKALDRLSLLDNPRRKEINNLILIMPGLNITRIAKTLGIFVTNAKWHVNALEKFQLIRSRFINDQIYYFPFSTSDEHDKINVLLNKNGMPEIIGFIAKNSTITITYFLKSIPIPKTTLLRKIKELVENGVIVVTRSSSGESYYSIQDSIKDFVMQRLKES